MTKKQRTRTDKRNVRRVLAVVLAILSIFIGWIIANNYWFEPRRDRQVFTALERALDDVSDRIATDAKQIIKEKSCSRPQEKYGPGALICSIEVQIPNSDVKMDANEVWKIFDSMTSFQKQGSGQGNFRQYSYKDIGCLVEISNVRHSIVCGRAVTRAIY